MDFTKSPTLRKDIMSVVRNSSVGQNFACKKNLDLKRKERRKKKREGTKEEKEEEGGREGRRKGREEKDPVPLLEQ